MAKPLRIILEASQEKEGKDTKLKGVKKSTVRSGEPTDEYPGMGPKEGDGKDFVKKHKVEVHADRVGNGDEDYKGKTKQTKYKRQSPSVYEETLHELSKDALKSYISMAIDPNDKRSISNLASRGGFEHGLSISGDEDSSDGEKYDKKAKKRSKFVAKALNKITGGDNKKKTTSPKKGVDEAASCDGQEPHETKKGKKLLLGGKKPIEERHMTSAEKQKEKRIKAKVDPSKMKASMKNQYGAEKGEQVYFATIRKKAMKETSGPDTPIKMPSGKVGDGNTPGFNV